MIQNTFDILSLSGEAAVCTRGGVIQYANAAACTLLGSGCIGRSLRDVFGEELSAVQSGSFIADFSLGARRCAARFSRLEKGYLIFLSPEGGDPAILNDPLLFSLRSSLMNMGIVTEGMRTLAEDRQDALLLRNAASLTQCYYKLMRQVENAGFVLGMLEGSYALNAFPVDLKAVCLSAVEAVSGFFPEVQIETVAECGDSITADPSLFKLLLNNLLDNCLVHAGCAHIRLRLSETPQSLMLSVSDDGCGIPAEQLHQAFDRYRYRFEGFQMWRGPGLGLSVARGVAQLHDGTLLLESRPGVGTAVRVTLSRSLASSGRLQESDGSPQYSTRDLLAGLADCLPEEAFTEKYLD